MKPARRSIASIVTVLVTLLAYVVSTTAAAAHLHVHSERGEDRGRRMVQVSTSADLLHSDSGCAICDGGPLLALPTVSPVAVPHIPLHVEQAVELRTAPPCADCHSISLRGPPAF